MDHPQSSSAEANPGLVAGLAGIAKNMFGLLVSRIELAALEFGEIRGNLAKLLLISALGIVALWFAIAYWTALVVILAWETWGWKILFLMAAVFTALAIGIFLYARSLLRHDKLSMPATLNELRNDRDALF
jgi:uncharacterized membrane protein YqjE